ncbi:superoxide dismutase [Williamwhitmania taraxaci]|uniref:Superoxide dismutase n=1 Tax=Williamwhitmania taraxaci TaxID=1640674 RepID=A0A1G6RPM1_9BACT|nr:superoxide dismutase [Williamwhitmania taraxaci]SDD05935.1 superoxide dismutase, Fe-Mn family [Williamwhitmania taraxaci]
MKRILLIVGMIGIGLVTNAQDTKIQAPISDELQRAYPFSALPYAYDALEKFVDKETMEIHYARHYKAYHSKFLAAIQGSGMEGKSMEEIFASMSKLSPAVKNNGGGYFNHKLFWEVMAPNGGGEPAGILMPAIVEAFGSFEAFKSQFEAAATGVFGSGWAWLAVDKTGKLFIASTANQDNTLMDIAPKYGVPVLALDVWEHAYYLRYQNKRADYVSRFWTVVNWPMVEQKFAAAVPAK